MTTKQNEIRGREGEKERKERERERWEKREREGRRRKKLIRQKWNVRTHARLVRNEMKYD